MDEDRIARRILTHWKLHYRDELRAHPDAPLRARAADRARLAVEEFRAFIRFGLDPWSAWQDAERLYVRVPPDPLRMR